MAPRRRHRAGASGLDRGLGGPVDAWAGLVGHRQCEVLVSCFVSNCHKYQPFVEKRHEQLKSVFDVTPVWLKNVGRVSSLLWLYYVVELVGALVEREVRRQMKATKTESLKLFPESRASKWPTAELVFTALEGHRRHRLLSASGDELRRFYDVLPEAALEVLDLLGIDRAPYGIT